LLCASCYEQCGFREIKNDQTGGSFVITCADYEGPIRSLITAMKFKHIKAVCTLLADISFYTATFPEIDLISAVPLHPRRKNNRGFDQAENIAKGLAQHLQVPYLPLLKRIQYHTPQSSIASKVERANRLNGAYAVNANVFSHLADHLKKNTHLDKPKISILIVDDVYTTGATLRECQKTLQSAAAEYGIDVTIHTFCIAHG